MDEWTILCSLMLSLLKSTRRPQKWKRLSISIPSLHLSTRRSMLRPPPDLVVIPNMLLHLILPTATLNSQPTITHRKDLLSKCFSSSRCRSDRRPIATTSRAGRTSDDRFSTALIQTTVSTHLTSQQLGNSRKSSSQTRA